MAHGKLRYIKAGGHWMGGNLAKALSYGGNYKKTDENEWIMAFNCSLGGEKSPAMNVYDQMMDTKRCFGQLNGRQGYDLILSFREEEKDKEKNWQILQDVAKELFGDRYETMICMHTNTKCMHGHITINSVSFVDGKKFRYERDDWKKVFQPVIDKYTLQAGYAMDRKTDKEEKSEYDGASWAVVNKSDIDEAIRKSDSYQEFETIMRAMGYYMDYGKRAGKTCLKIRKADAGQQKYRRCTEETLGYGYTLEGIRERIAAKGKAYPRIMVEAGATVVKIRYSARYQKRVFRKWEELSPLERFELRQYFKYRNQGKTNYRINWKVVRKYQRLAEDSLRKRDLLLKYGIDSYQKFSPVRENINRREKACYEKLEELRHYEAVFQKEAVLYQKIQSCVEEGKISEANTLSFQLKKEYGHTVGETKKFIQRLSEQKKNLKKEAAIYRKERKKLDEIQKEYAKTYDLEEPGYLKEESGGLKKDTRKNFFQKK